MAVIVLATNSSINDDCGPYGDRHLDPGEEIILDAAPCDALHPSGRGEADAFLLDGVAQQAVEVEWVRELVR